MEYVLRPVKVGDAEGINALPRMPGVFENILGLPTEKVARSEKFLAGLDDNSQLLAAVAANAEGKETVLGVCGLEIDRNPRNRHVASLGMMVHVDYQGQGIGAALLTAILDLADNWLRLVRVELLVFADNERAIHLYEKFGFEREGVRRCAAVRHGTYADELYMARIRHQ